MTKVRFEMWEGEWVKVSEPVNTHRDNFKITFNGADWSGWRALEDCISQVPNWKGRTSGSFKIVEE